MVDEALRFKAKQEKWHRSNVSYLQHDGQRIIEQHFKTAPGQLFVCNISRQWGKSYWAVSKCIELALAKPKARIKYGTAFQTDLTEFILPTFDIVLADCPKSIKPRYKTHGSKWVFPNGSEIKLVGLDKSPNSLRGNVIDLIVIDEAGFVDNLQYVYSSVIVPATLHRPNCRIIFISTPPQTPAHAFVDFCLRAETEGAYVKLDIYSNPRITEADIDRMAKEVGGKDSTTFRREFLCEFITDSDLAIIPEWDDKYVQEIEHDEYYGYYHKYDGMDLGVKDKTALIFGHYDFKRASLIIEHELEMKGATMNTELLVNAIKAKEKEIWGEVQPFRRVSDNNWPIMMLDFSSIHNLTFIATTKDNLEAMINEVRIMVQNGQLIVHPRCKFLIGCLKYGVWNNKKTEFARSQTYGHFDHLAALIYLVRNLAKHTNPIPATHGHENHRSWMKNANNQQSNNAKTIANMFAPKKKY